MSSFRCHTCSYTSKKTGSCPSCKSALERCCPACGKEFDLCTCTDLTPQTKGHPKK